MADGTLIFDTRLDTDGLSTEVNKLTKSTSAFGDVMKGVLGANLVQNAGEKLLDFAKDAITAASDLEEVQNVVDVTFGESAEIINDFATDGAKAFGLTELQTKRYTGTLGALFKSMGLGQDEVTDFSVTMAGLVGDMASFYNLDYETAFEKLRSGISGETEPLKQLGVNMSVANLEAFALSQGIKTSYEEMSEAQKATLRYKYIMEATTDAQGDFNRTQDSFANQLRILENNFSTLSANVGEVLLPVLTTTLSTINAIFNWSFSGQKTELQKSIEAAAESLTGVQTEIDNIRNDYAATTIQITIDYKKAEGLLEDYEALKGIQDRSEAQTSEMKSIVETLVAMYPELSKYVGKDGLFKKETDQVQELITQYSELARVKAYQQMVSEIYGEYLKSEFEYAQLSEKKNVAGARVSELEEQYEAISNLITQINNIPMFAQWEMDLYGGFMDEKRVQEAADALQSYIDAMGGFDSATLESLSEAGVNISSFIDETGNIKDVSSLDVEGIADIFQTLSTLSEPENLGEALSNTSDALISAQESFNSANEAMSAGLSSVQSAYENLETAVAGYEQLTGESGDAMMESVRTSVEEKGGTIVTSAGEVGTKAAQKLADTDSALTSIDAMIRAVNNKISEARINDIVVNIRTNYAGSANEPAGRKHATGLDYIPYDEYPASLHRGEAVLRADDAARWRSGQGGGNNTEAIAALTQSVQAVASRPVKVYIGKKEVVTAVADGMYAEMNGISRSQALGVGK